MTFEELKINAEKIGVILDDSMIEKFKKYASFLFEKNQVMNLTAIKTLDEVVEKHFYDSLLLLKSVTLKNSTLLDIGSGAGFPGIVVAIVEPTSKVTVLDATAKKVKFLRELADFLELTNVEFINARVEDVKSKRESYDYVTARAFASLPVLLEVGIPLLKVGGTLVSLKSAKAEEEISNSKVALRKLESVIERIDKNILPSSGDIRVNILIVKKQKSPKYLPRSWAEISAKPF